MWKKVGKKNMQKIDMAKQPGSDEMMKLL